MISFAQFEEHLAGWLFDDRGIVSFRVPLSAKEATRTCGEFRRLTSAKNSDLASLHKTGHALFDVLLGPVEDRLDESRTLALEPDGPCSGIAFEALTDRRGDYLADRFVLVTSPGSFAVEQWRPERYRVSADLQAIVVGDPRISGDLGTIYPELPDARLEARTVARIFPHNSVFIGKNATLDAVENALPQAKIFHFAGHGLSTSENGTLLLSAPGSAAGVALFDSTQAEAAASRCHLAVLSACFSAPGEQLGPFNVDSLVQAFWRAGVPNVLAARWAVDSRVTYGIVNRFYPLLLEGMPPAAALRESARAVRRDPAFSHPAFWAGFHIFGSPITIDKETKQ